MRFREERAKKTTSSTQAMPAATPAPAAQSCRQVYDSQNQSTQKVKLVRGEGDAATPDPLVNEAFDFAGAARDYFLNKFGRRSIDNLGMNITVNVHYGKNYMNAFWDGDEMTYGDGDGKIFGNFAKSLDVMAHEMAHGITQFVAPLVYQKQPGALNEHFSDVFGTVVTQHVQGQTAHNADWLLGDEIMGPELYGEALRSMRAPGTAYDNPLMGKDPQPDHMKDYFTGSMDNYGVHINSGIPNKAFYLAAMEMGTEEAALIWYTALHSLWPTAQFNDMVIKVAEAARILIKGGKARPGATQMVRAAFKAVGLPA